MTEKICIYEKGLLLKLSSECSVKQIITLLGGDAISDQKMKDFHLWIFNKKSRIEPPKVLEKELEITKSNGWYTYEIYFLSFEVKSDSFIFILSPLSKLLKIFDLKLNVLGLTYVACNMNGLFNHRFYKDSNDELIFVKRVNAQVLGEENKSVITVSLFGRDILKSETLKKILGKNFLKENYNWYDSMNPFIPNSIRLTYEDGTEKRNEEFSLNMDKFGNYSFYLRKQSDFNKLLHIVFFLFKNELFVNNIYISPLTRNEQAIKIIEV